MIDRTKLGLRIREARQRMNMSQQQLATAVGVSDKTISAYEVGRVDPPLDTLEKLSAATSHPIAYFVGDIQSNIEARLDRIANELTEIRQVLKAAPKPVVQNVQQSETVPKPSTDMPSSPDVETSATQE